MKKKLVAVLLSACTILTLLGCGQTETQQSAEQKTSEASVGESKTEESASEEVEEIDYAFGAYDETITITTANAVQTAWPEGDNENNNAWTRALLEKLNIKLETEWTSDEYSTKLNLAIANGDLPDVFEVSNISTVRELAEAGLIWDLTEIYETYASDTVKGYAEKMPEIHESSFIDGKMYAVAQLNTGYIEQPDYVWIRNDWKEALNLQDPESMDDLKNIMLAFIEEYGGYGMAINNFLNRLFLILPGWHVYPGMWVTCDDGSIGYSYVQPEMKNALADFAEWYELGIFHSEFATRSASVEREALLNGEVGVQPFFQYWGYDPGVFVVQNFGEEAIFYPYAIPSADGEEVKVPISFTNHGYTVVSKECENPEAAIKMMNYFAYINTDAIALGELSVDDIAQYLDVHQFIAAICIFDPDDSRKQYDATQKAVKEGDTSDLYTSVMWTKYNNSKDWIDNKTAESVGDYLQQGYERSSFTIGFEFLDNDKYVLDRKWGPMPADVAQYESPAYDLLIEGFTKIILGEEPVDYFDTLVENWYAAGGDLMTEAINRDYGDK